MVTDVHLLVSNVNSGEISPQLDARVDTEKHKSSARILENFIIKPYGGISKRPGTEYLNTTKSGSAARLEPFANTAEDNYLLEISNENIRVWKNDGPLLIDATTFNTWTSANWTSGTEYLAGETITSITTGNGLYYTAISNHSATSANVPRTGESWASYWDYFTYNPGDIVRYYNNDTSQFDLYRCNEPVNTVSIPPTATSHWSSLERYSGNNFYMDIKVNYRTEDLFDIQTVQLNDVMLLAHPAHYPKRLSKYSDSRWIFESVPFAYAPSLDPNEDNITVQLSYNYPMWKLYSGVWQNATVYDVGDYIYDNGPTYYIYECIQAHTSDSGNEPVGVTSAFWRLVRYEVGDRVVNSNNEVFTCYVAHIPSFTSTSDPKYEPNITTGQWEDYWNIGSNTAPEYPAWQALPLYQLIYYEGDRVTHNGEIYECINANWSYDAPTQEPGVGTNWTSFWKLITVAQLSPTRLVYELNSTVSLFASGDIDNIWTLPIGVDDNSIQLNLNVGAGTYTTDALFIQSEYLVQSNWAAASSPPSTITLEESLDNETWQTIKTWKILDVNEGNINYSAEAPIVGAWYRIKAVKTDGTNGRLLKLESVMSTLTVPFKITEYVSPTKVIGYVNLPGGQDAPDNILGVNCISFKKPAFSTSTGYPRSVAYHENRVWWGGIDVEPGRMWGSVREDFYNYLLGSGPTDALDITLGSTSTNRILWAKSFNRSLVIGTEGELFTVDSGETDVGLNPSNIRARLRVKYGCSNIPGYVTGESLLFMQRGNKRLREFAYRYDADAYFAPDMTLLAEHVASDGFVQAAYQTNIEPVLWSVTNKGALVGFSYDREQQITAWHRHITGDRAKYYAPYTTEAASGDKFTSVAVLPAGGSLVDQIWFVVKRIVNGQAIHYVERFSPPIMNLIYGGSWNNIADSDMWKYLDSCKIPSSVDVTTDTVYNGFSHLNGRQVNYIAYGGENYDDTLKLVTDGSFTVAGDTNPTDINAGLPVFSVFVPPRIEVGLPNGTIQDRKIRMNRIAFKLWRSIGGEYKLYDGDLSNPVSAQNVLEQSPLSTDTFDSINYTNFLYGLSTDFPRPSTDDHQPTYTGQTTDQYINGNWFSNNMLFAVVHNAPTPFNMLGMIQKIEISGN